MSLCFKSHARSLLCDTAHVCAASFFKRFCSIRIAEGLDENRPGYIYWFHTTFSLMVHLFALLRAVPKLPRPALFSVFLVPFYPADASEGSSSPFCAEIIR